MPACTPTRRHVNTWGGSVSLTSENDEILDFFAGSTWRASILTPDRGAHPVIFEILGVKWPCLLCNAALSFIVTECALSTSFKSNDVKQR